jgi:hypothetical protein
LNQAQFLEATIRSVLESEVAPDEYVIADGGSTDGSVEIIDRHAPELTHWWSRRDSGQYDAINRGFAFTSGEIMAWLNSDDVYMPWTLAVVKEVFASLPEIEWLTTLYPLTVDAGGRVVSCVYTGGFDRASLRAGANLPSSPGFWRGVQQESTFWRRSLWDRAGGRVDSSLELAGDFELWHRFAAEADLVGLEAPLAAFRSHGDQKSVTLREQYLEEGLRVVGGAQRASRLRGAWSMAVGRRSLKRLPRPLAGGLAAARLLRRTRVCAWRDGSWVLLDDFVA